MCFGIQAEKNLEVSVQLQQQEMEAEEKILLLERQKKVGWKILLIKSTIVKQKKKTKFLHRSSFYFQELEEETIAQRHIIELERVKTQQV